MSIPPKVILASRSPRRRELLRLLVDEARIEILPPSDAREAGFDELPDLPAIEGRLMEIARTKERDVAARLAARESPPGGSPPILIAADTTVVAQDSSGRPLVLGQPPEDETWRDVVRQWFREYYAGRTHRVITSLCVSRGASWRSERIVRSEVTFTADVDRHLEWYLSTGEPRGKAGGYAIQGAGSLFVTKVEGSLSNVVGLPLEALREILGDVSRPS